MLFGMTNGHRGFLIAVLLLGCPALAGEPGRVAIQRVTAQRCGAATVTATPLCSQGDCGRSVVANSEVMVDLSAAEEWSIDVAAAGCWAPSVRVRRDNAGPIVIPLWPAAVLSGRLALPKGVEAPQSVAVQIQSPPDERPAVPATSVQCPVAEGVFRCAVPAARLDVRVSAEGFVPRYFWGVERASLDVVPLARGGSLAGIVRFAGKGPPLSEVSLELKPALPSMMGGGSTTEEKRLASLSMTAHANARGFFQFAALEPGQYTLTARRDGWSTLRKSEIRVADGQETSLDTVTIEPLSRVEVLIQPPLDPYGKPWKASVQEMTPLSTLTVPIAEGNATLSGVWVAEGVDARVHRLDIRDHLGNPFAYSIVDVTRGMPPVMMTIHGIAVHGTIAVGDEPLRIRLEFMNGKGTSIAMQSDADGQFAGALPDGGAWQVMIVDARRGIWLKRNVTIDREDAVAEVDLKLPNTRLAGKVVSADGDPVAATLKVYDEKGNYIAGTKSGPNGEFQFVGLEASSVRLLADSTDRRASSGLVPLTVVSDSTDEVTVVLRSQVTFKGRLVTPSGLPVAGAIVRWLRPGMHGVSQEEVSNPNGVFTIRVPQGAPSLDLIVLPPAMPAKVLSVPLGAELNPSTDIVVGGPAGVLEVELNRQEPLPWLRHGGSVFGISLLQYPFNWESTPRDWRPWGMAIELEAGEYTICGDREMSARCVRKLISPGTIERVDARALLQ